MNSMKTSIVALIAAAGLVSGCNRSVQSASQDFNSLPPDVQKAIRSDAPNAEISSISKTTQNGIEAYKVDLSQDGKSAEMVVASDGRVLSSDLPNAEPANPLEKAAHKVGKALAPTGAVGTDFSALPESVQKTIQAHAPDSEIASISKHTDNGRVIYEVAFKDQGKNPTIQVAEDGTLVQDLSK